MFCCCCCCCFKGKDFYLFSSLLCLIHIGLSKLVLSKCIHFTCNKGCVPPQLVHSCPTLCDPMDCSLARLLCPWDSPGKYTGMGCHFLLHQIKFWVKQLFFQKAFFYVLKTLNTIKFIWWCKICGVCILMHYNFPCLATILQKKSLEW